MEDCYHYKELIKHLRHESPYKPVVACIDDMYYIIDMMTYEPFSFKMKLFKIDLNKFELIEGSKKIIDLDTSSDAFDIKYLKLEDLYNICIRQQRKNKISSIYE